LDHPANGRVNIAVIPVDGSWHCGNEHEVLAGLAAGEERLYRAN